MIIARAKVTAVCTVRFWRRVTYLYAHSNIYLFLGRRPVDVVEYNS